MSTGVRGTVAPVVRRGHLRPSEGVRVGLVGATAIWLWLALVDFVVRTPLHTSEVLGRGVLVLLSQTALPGHAWPTIFGGHLIGLVAAGLYLRRRHPDLMARLRREGSD